MTTLDQCSFRLLQYMCLAMAMVTTAQAQVSGQARGVFSTAPPSFGRPDPCAGTGIVGSSSYGACQLREQTLRQGTARAPDLRSLNHTDRLRIEQTCATDLSRGDAVYAACLKQELVAQGQDLATPVRRIPQTQRKPMPQTVE